MHNFDIYVNGNFFDCLHFDKRKTLQSVYDYVKTEMKLQGSISIHTTDKEPA